MSYIKLKEQISKLYSQLDNFNSNSNQSKKKNIYNNNYLSNDRKIQYNNLLFSKNNTYKTNDLNSRRINNDSKRLFRSKSIFDFRNEGNSIFNKKNYMNQNFQKKYNEIKNFTNEFNPNSFDILTKKNNLKRTKSSYFNVLNGIQSYKNDKRMSKKDILTKEILFELGNGIKEKSNKNQNLLGVGNYSDLFSSKGKKDEYTGIQGVNII